MADGRPRRRSVFAGLILLLIGILLLYHNFYGGFDFWHVFATWWPALLIIWGLAKLFDYFVAQRTGEAAPRTITGGDIFLVLIILCLAGSVAAWDRWRFNPAIDEEIWQWGTDSYNFTEEVPAKTVSPKAPLTIRTSRGNISVFPDTTDQIRATARKTVRESDESSAQKVAQQVTVTVNSTGDGFEISPQNQDVRRGRVTVDLEVHVPKGASLTLHSERGNVLVNENAGSVRVEGGGDVEVHNTSGDVTVDSPRGDQRIEKVKGNVRLSGRGGQVDISDVQGDVVVDGSYSGPLRFERIAKSLGFNGLVTTMSITQASGRVEIGSGRFDFTDIPGGLDLRTSNRDLTFDNVTGQLHIEARRAGDVELRFSQPPKQPIDLTTDSGSIEISLPTKSAFDLDASTRRGEISTDFEELSGKITESDQSKDRNTRLAAKLGANGPVIRLRSTYGTISIRKGK